MKIFFHAHKKKILVSVSLIVVFTVLGFVLKPSKEEPEIELVQLDDIQRIVSVSGTIESEKRVDLRFGIPGKVDIVYGKSGQFYNKGDLLFALDTRKVDADLARAQANVASAQADFDLMMAGPSKEEEKVSFLQVEEAKIRHQRALVELENTLLNNAEEARRAQFAIDKSNLNLDKAREELRIINLQGGNSLTQEEVSIRQELDESKTKVQTIINELEESLWDIDLLLGRDTEPFNPIFEALISQAPGLSEQDLLIGYLDAKQKRKYIELEYLDSLKNWDLVKAKKLLEDSNLLAEAVLILLDIAVRALDAMDVPTGDVGADIDSLMATLSSDRLSLQNALQATRLSLESLSGVTNSNLSLDLESSLLQANNQYEAMLLALETAKSEAETVRVQSVIRASQMQSDLEIYASMLAQAQAKHENLIAEPRPVELASYRARIREAQANLQRSAGERREALIYAPSDGVLGRIEVNVGDQVASSNLIAPFVSEDYRVAVNVSESDIALLSLGQKAELSLDALNSKEMFTGELVAIDPVETNIQGVIYYEVILFFDQQDTRFKPGMTVNIDILTAEAEQVLSINPSSLLEDEKGSYVYVLEDGKTEKRAVTIGLEGDTAFEIKDGLIDGEKVVLYPEDIEE